MIGVDPVSEPADNVPVTTRHETGARDCEPEIESVTASAEVTVVDELATVLFALSPGSLTTGAVTAQITQQLTAWALGQGWLPRTEARVQVDGPPARRPRLGYLDLIVRRGPLDADLAIEIDSADKPWSVAKLRHAAAAGMIAIWVRWGDEAWAGTYDGIDVIQLPATRRSASRRSPNLQLTLWQ